MLRGLENEEHRRSSYINFIYKGQRISTCARFQNDEKVNEKHENVKCGFNPKCSFNEKINSIEDLQKHYIDDHRSEVEDQNRSVDPIVLFWFGSGWYIYVQCGSCHKMQPFAWEKHAKSSDCAKKRVKWECLNVEYLIARSQFKEYSACVDITSLQCIKT